MLMTIALALLAILAGPAAAATGAPPAAEVAAAPLDATTPTSQCLPPGNCNRPTPSPGTPPPSATATPKPHKAKPTFVPIPPPTAAPTTKPTPYVEPIAAAGTPMGLPAEHSATAITPLQQGASTPSLIELAVVAMIALGVLAAASFFLFFKLR